MKVSDDLIAVIWTVPAVLLFASVTTSLATALLGSAFVPAWARRVNDRFGWPGPGIADARGIGRVILLLLGMGLIVLTLYVPVTALLSTTIHRSAAVTTLLSVQLAASLSWALYLLRSWRAWRSKARSS